MNFHTKQEQWGLSALRAGQTLPLKEMNAILQKKIRFFFLRNWRLWISSLCLFTYVFYEFCLPLLGLPHHLAERTEVRLFELIYVKRSKSFFFFSWKGRKTRMKGRLSSEGIWKRKSMFMPLGVVVGCLSSRLSLGKELLLLSLLSTSKERD